VTAKLELYNDALLNLGERKLASLSENREPRRALDDAYDKAVDYCLEQGYWNFAMRTVQIDSSASVVPTFGYSFAFVKPGDFIRMYRQSQSEQLEPPLLDITDEPGYWYANCDPLYVKYVSNDTAYGKDLSLWSETFADYVAMRLALKTCKRITGKEPSDDLVKGEKKARMDARAKDAMNEPPGFPPTGTWVQARRSFNSGSRRDDPFT
jgi:hypothetical protein